LAGQEIAGAVDGGNPSATDTVGVDITRSVAEMAKPVLLVVDDETASLVSLTQELESRYGVHYRIISSPSAQEAVARLEELRPDGTKVPLILADQWMPGETGIEFLARARELHPTARRGLLISWGDRSAVEPILEAAALGQIEFYLPKPAWSPDEQFHRTITEALEEWWRQRGEHFEAVTVIGDYPSPRVHEIRDVLTRNNVPFGFHRSDSEAGRMVLERLGVQSNQGPVVALYNGVVLVEPTNVEVAAALGVDVQPSERTYDVAIVGAGPAGLAAAVYGASEGLTTALLEREAFGGQAGTSSLIRNYLGFPRGVSGVELAWRAYEQAWIFGTNFIYGNPASSLVADGPLRIVRLQDGSEVRSRAVIIATGMSYRRLGIPSLERLVGAGVFYGAATVESQAVVGKHACVVGGGNSAGQAALHLAKYAERVTVLVRSESLATSMSEYLIREIDNAKNVDVRFGTEVVGGGGDARLQYLDLRDRRSGQTEQVPAAGLFVLIGAEPFTGWLPESVSRDAWGFILTGPDVAERWRQERPPLLLEMSVPGVFAVGDVRHGSVKRVASAVGEGSIAIRMVHDYLAASSDGHGTPLTKNA
jgi:thioredoxin reductase (NADPH)